jgi:flagellar basal-body rod modification protein FlgD
MATSPTSAIDSATKAAGLSMDDLLKILMTELTYQDPLKPVENKEFLAQMAQFSSLETSRQLNDNITRMLSLQSLNQSVGLLGKTVDATTNTGTVSGQVTALSLNAGEPQITLRNANGELFTGITLAQVQTIR